MFSSRKKDINEILNALESIESFIKEDINKIELKKNNCNSENKKVMEKIINISNLIQTKQQEDLSIYGEIMLCTEKLSDGFTNDRVTKTTSNNKLNYIAKSINAMSKKLEEIIK